MYISSSRKMSATLRKLHIFRQWKLRCRDIFRQVQYVDKFQAVARCQLVSESHTVLDSGSEDVKTVQGCNIVSVNGITSKSLRKFIYVRKFKY